MSPTDVSRYFEALDFELAMLTHGKAKTQIAEDFPKYLHFGPYEDPTDEKARSHLMDFVSNHLHGYNFDPLLAFTMNQPKYSTEVLHPDCACFRRMAVKERPIKSCSHRDRLLFASWNDYLSAKHKRWLQTNDLMECVSAYVPNTGKSNVHYAKAAFDYIQGKQEYSAVALDIKSFFDKIPHVLLKQNLLMLLDLGERLDRVNHILYKAVTKYTYCNRQEIQQIANQLHQTPGTLATRHKDNWAKLKRLKLLLKNEHTGIPQGLACSGVLANIIMMQFDVKMSSITRKNNGIYIRYADDIFIAASNLKTRRSLQAFCLWELRKIKLPIALKKTETFDYSAAAFEHPRISYLGLTCKGSKISVRQNGVNKFYNRTSRFIHSYISTCKRRGIRPSVKKIRGIFGHTGKRNYYSYLTKAAEVFEVDDRYKAEGIKGVLKNHIPWLTKVFKKANRKSPPDEPGQYRPRGFCNCPLRRDG